MRPLCTTTPVSANDVYHRPTAAGLCSIIAYDCVYTRVNGYAQCQCCLTSPPGVLVHLILRASPHHSHHLRSHLITEHKTNIVQSLSNLIHCWNAAIFSIDGHRHLRSARRGHELDCQHREDARSVMLETLFLSVLTTMHCLCLTLGTSSNISTSRPTSTLTAFEDYYRLLLHKLQRQTTDSQLRNASLYSAFYTANSKLKQPTYVQAYTISYTVI